MSSLSPASHKNNTKPLPPGWKWVKLGDVCEINPRRPTIDKADDFLTTFIPMEAVDALSGKITAPQVKKWSEVKKGYTFFTENDVLFAKITPCMQNGKHSVAKNLIDGFGFGTTEFHVLRPKGLILSDIIWYFLRQPVVLQKATEHFTGAVGQQRLPQDYLKTLDLPLPPLPEQKRIASILKEQLTAIDKARKAAEERLEAIKTLPAAFLRKVFPKPGQPLPDGWKWVKLGEVCEVNPRKSTLERDDNVLTSFVPMEAVDATTGIITAPQIKSYKNVKKGYTFFIEKDVLFAKITPCMQNGKHSIAHNLIDGIGFGTTEFHVLRPKEVILSEIIWYFLRQPNLLIKATEHFTGAVGQQRLPQDYLKTLDLPLPPFVEQKRFASKLIEQMAAVEKARIAAEEELKTINALPAAILRKAFNGGI